MKQLGSFAGSSKVTWDPKVLERAAETGLTLDEKQNLVASDD